MRSRQHALRGVDLTVDEGEFTAIVGPSGSGKTTMLQLMGCLDRPTSGRVHINGQDVSRLNANKRADLRKGTIGFVFQFFALIPGLTAYENVELPSAAGRGQEGEAAGTRQRVAGGGGPHRPRPSPSRPDERRRAAARGHRPRPGRRSRVGAGRRADRQPGHRERPPDHGAHAAAERGDGTTFVFATHDPRVFPFARRVVEVRDGKVTENSKHA